MAGACDCHGAGRGCETAADWIVNLGARANRRTAVPAGYKNLSTGKQCGGVTITARAAPCREMTRNGIVQLRKVNLGVARPAARAEDIGQPAHNEHFAILEQSSGVKFACAAGSPLNVHAEHATRGPEAVSGNEKREILGICVAAERIGYHQGNRK